MQLNARKSTARKIGVSPVTLWRLVKAGKFPPPIKVSSNRVGWLDSDIEAFIAGLKRTDGSPVRPEVRAA
jgi:predicted DNA-binding transcriptional regulator AlpA